MINQQLSKCLVSQIARRFSAAKILKETDERVISLTIDDAPARNENAKESTRKILEAIESHNQTFSTKVSATFFVITDHVKHTSNRERLDAEILTEIVAKGHEIGNHGNCDRRHVCLSKTDFEIEFLEAHRFLSERVNHPIRWFRPGQGFYNDSMLEILKTVGKDLGYEDKLALVSMIPLDTLKLFNDPAFTLNYITNFIFPGSILILHAGFTHQAFNTVAVLNQLLRQLHQQNYQVVSLSKLFN